jgi:Spy/CpxP family protein refolding chaperone
MRTIPSRTLLTIAATAALAVGGAAPAAFARHGADDPPGHDAGDDHGGKAHFGKSHRRVTTREIEKRHGADDPAGHRRHGGDDGPNHT